MNQYAGTLIVCVCLGAVAAIGAGCDSGSSNNGGAAGTGVVGTAGAPAGTAGAPAGTAGAPAGTAGAPAGTAGAGTGGGAAAGDVVLPVGDTGFVSLPTLGIQGAWYGYGDGEGADGTVAMSDCVLKGMHMPADCSMITAPPFGMFPQTTPGKMCTSGTVAKVINTTVGCAIVPPATTPPAMCPDYSNLFGAGIGLDLNNAGADGGGGKMPFNATMAGITGISFDLDMPPAAGVRVEFPTVGTENTSGVWKPTGSTNLSPLVAGHNVLLFADVKSPSFVKPAIPFDPTKLLSIQFHVPTKTSASAMYSFCISNLAVITGTAATTPVTGTAGASGTAGAASCTTGAPSGTAGAPSGTAGAPSGTAGAASGGAAAM